MSRYRSKYDNKSDEDTSGFVDINNLYNKATDVKIDTVEKSIEALKSTMDKYMNDCMVMWNEEIVPFSQSKNCMIFQNMNLTEKDCLRFLEFMKSQKQYKIMKTSLIRLEIKKDYLLKHHS